MLRRLRIALLCVLSVSLIFIISVSFLITSIPKPGISLFSRLFQFHEWILSTEENVSSRKEFGRDKKVEKVRCLIADPPIEFKEQIFGEVRLLNGRPCAFARQNVSFNLDFNIERSIRFGFLHVDSLGSGQTRGPLDVLHESSNRVGIPKTVHFIWNDDYIPHPFVKNLKQFGDLHPSWNIYFWTLKYGREFIRNNEPHILETFDRYPKNVSRADALRYVVMYHFGGAYLDLDCEPVIPLDDLTMKGDCVIGPEPIENAVFVMKMRSLLSNAAFLCKPGHAFLRHLIDSLNNQPDLNNALEACGPVFMTHRLNSYVSRELFNTNASENPRPVDISIVKHDYFELTPQKWLSNKAESVYCKAFLGKVKIYFEDCYKNNKTLKKCVDLRRFKSMEEEYTFDACLEWIEHGGTKRTTNSVRYLNHEHYGTYSSRNIAMVESIEISEILPRVKKMGNL